MTTYLQIALPVPLPGVFDYRMPADWRVDQLKTGMRVEVPFGKRQLVGILVGMSQTTTCPPDKLKTATTLLDDSPIMDALTLELCRRASDYYHYPIGEVVVGTLPKLIRQGRAVTEEMDCRAALAMTEKQHATQILTEEQQSAVDKINLARDFKPFLLMGVTGSGKTEVYLRAIETVLQQGKQVLILVPEIGLTPQTVERFVQRFSQTVVELHSDLTDKQRFTAWCAARDGSAKIIIGTRSAIFAPFNNLGMIVIDEEHDASFKQQTGFRYSARDLAVWRAQMQKIPIILGSATPSLESFYNAQQQRYELLVLNQRIHQRPAAPLKLINLKTQSVNSGLSHELLQTMHAHLAKGQQVMIFLNRRGFAPTLMCTACSLLLSCKRCDARLTLHKKRQRLVCHHCGGESMPPRICPECHQAEMLAVGQGTERIELALSEIFPNYPLVRIDRDTTRKKNSLQEMLDQIHSGAAKILIGTQMLAKGHHFPNLSLVALVDVDGGLFSADFRATEKMAQLITQVAGRAGREEIVGEVLLQTHVPDHPLLHILLQQDYLPFLKSTLQEREVAMLPPFAHLALLKAEAVKQTNPQQFLTAAKKVLAKNSDVNCLGPVPAQMAKKAGKYCSHLLLQAQNRSLLQQLLRSCVAQLTELPEAKSVRWVLDVDPMEV